MTTHFPLLHNTCLICITHKPYALCVCEWKFACIRYLFDIFPAFIIYTVAYEIQNCTTFLFFISQQTLYFGNFQIVPPLALSMKGSVTKHWQCGLFQRGVLICNVQHELCCQCHTGGWYFWTWINKPKSTLIYNYRKKIVNVLLNQWSHVQMCFLDQRDVTRIPEKWRNVIQSQNESFQKIKVLANINV